MRLTNTNTTIKAKPATGRGSTIDGSLKKICKASGFNMSLRRRSTCSSVMRMPSLPNTIFQIDSATSINDNDNDNTVSSLLAGTGTTTTASLALNLLDVDNKMEEEEEEAYSSDSVSISSSEPNMEVETAAEPDAVVHQEEEEEEKGEEASLSSDSRSISRSELNTELETTAGPVAVVFQEEEEEEKEVKQAIIDPVMTDDDAVDVIPTVSQEEEEREGEEDDSVLAPVPKKAKTTINNIDSACMMATTTTTTTSEKNKLDHIDLDHITVDDLQGLTSDDGDILRAKHLNTLSKLEREYVLYDIHGVADYYIANNAVNIDSSLKDLRIELTNELMTRKKNMNEEKKNNGTSATTTTAATEGTTDDAQQDPQDDDVVTATIDTAVDNLNSNKDDYLGNIFKMDYPTNHHHRLRSSAANNAMFSIPSGLFSDSNSNSNNNNNVLNNYNSMSLTSAYTKALSTTAQCDDALLESSSKATAYEQALAQCRGRRRERNNSLFRDDIGNGYANDDERYYIDVESSDFLTSFLRSEQQQFENDTNTNSTTTTSTSTSLLVLRKAACRILDYFEEKKMLFGVDLLTTKIQLHNLDNETKLLLESGCMQLLPERDRAGRAIIVGTKKLAPDNNNGAAALRAFWFLCSVALEDSEIETKGIVFVYYTLGGTADTDIDTDDDQHRQQRQRCFVQWGNVLQALPLRVASIHWCVENYQEEDATNLSALLLGKSNFVRVRCHTGTDSDVQYQLMTFGIPTNLLPIKMNGDVNVENVCCHVRDFLQQRKMLESHSDLLNKALAVLEDSTNSNSLSATIINLDDCIALVEDEDEDVGEVDDIDVDTDVDTVCTSGGVSVSVPIDTSIFSPSNLLIDDNTRQEEEKEQQQHGQNNICNVPFNDMFLLNTNNNNNMNMNMHMNTSNNVLMQVPLPSLPSSSSSSMEYHLYQQQQLQQEKQLLVRQLQKHQQELRLSAEKQILVNQLQKQQQELGQLMQSQRLQQLQSSSTATPAPTPAPAPTTITITPPSIKKEYKRRNSSTCTTIEDPDVDIIPGELDILLGRGRGAQNHKGNIHYRQVVETFRKQYEKIPNKGEKTLFIREVVDIIYDNGGQFLKKNPSGSGKWVRINPDVAREKVSHSFRNAKRLESYEK